MTDLLQFDTFELSLTIMNLVVILVILTIARIVAGFIFGTSSLKELTEKDNPAFGIVVAGMLTGIGIMLTGVSSGDFGWSYLHELGLVVSHGILGIGLMWIAFKVFDHFSMPHLDSKAEVLNMNTSVAVIVASNMIATGIIIRAVMMWADGHSYSGILIILLAYLLSQVILTVVSRIRVSYYERKAQGSTFVQAMQEKNMALALRFAGFRIGVALAMTTASGIVVFNGQALVEHISLWWGVALAMVLIFTLITSLLQKAIFPSVDLADEVHAQQNIAVATLQIALYCSVGLVLIGLV